MTTCTWAVIVSAPPDELELLAADLFAMGSLGVELQEPGMQLMPGTPPLSEGMGRAIGHFDEFGLAQDAARMIGVAPPVEVEEKDWSIAWRALHKGRQVGPRSWAGPPWEAVKIDPGMAFGTGSHPTTALCLERCDELLAERPGADVLDVGFGSGIIALLAARLGAGRVVGTENDPITIEIAMRGAELNGIPRDRVEFRFVEPEVPGQFDIVVANILLNTLVELAPQISRKVRSGGRVVLSGLLADQADAAQRAYVAQGLQPVLRRQREEWMLVELEKP